MRTHNFKAPSGGTVRFSAQGLGTASIGNLYRARSDAEADAAMEAAWNAGIRYYDTAPLYGLGLAETRLNRFLRTKPREEYVISTKVGRRLIACRPEQRSAIGAFFETPARRELFDYSYDGVMRSFEDSLERLGVDRIDILFVHDVDVFTHKSAAARDARIAELMAGGYSALASLRDQGAVRAIGVGVNEFEACNMLMERGEFDLFLLAGRYTLLEQQSLETFLPRCVERGIGIVIGGALNSGILATGAVPGAWYNYAPAGQQVLDAVAALEKVCATHGVRLPDAAMLFPGAHPAVVSTLIGAGSAEEVARSMTSFDTAIPSGFWAELKARRLLYPDAPVPG